jgi:hypothetical protein
MRGENDMPSGHKIDWSRYDVLILKELQNYTIVGFTKKFLPEISEKAISTRARKLGIKPKRIIFISLEHKKAISRTLSKETPELVEKIKQNRDIMSIVELAKSCNISTSLLFRIIRKYNITLSNIGLNRIEEKRRIACIGKIPWNKEMKMSNDFKKKISEAVSGKKNSQYGRKMTNEEKEQCHIRYFTTGINTMRKWLSSPEGQKTREKSLKTTTSEDFKCKCSRLMTQRILDGKFNPKTRGHGLHIISTKGGSFTTKSTYETKYVEILEHDENVLFFKYEPSRIEYIIDGIRKLYIPDFLVFRVDRIELVEVKPSKLINIGRNPAKFEAAERYCIGEGFDFVIITEVDLTKQI